MSSQLVRVVWAALEQGEIDSATAIRELQAGLPGGVAAVVPFTRHPVAAVRLAAIGAAAACGHAGVIDEVEQPARTETPVGSEGAIEACESPCEPAALAFTLLGGFSATRGGWCADDAAWERRVAQRLVRFLLVHRDRRVSEDELLETFWPERDLDSARRCLHVAISRARRVLDPRNGPSLIDTSDRVYHLRLRPGDWVDADDFETTALTALAQPGASRLRSLERAGSLWGGEPLPEERYSDWALGWRERLTDLHVAILAALADEYMQRGDVVAAGLRARELVELDPLPAPGQPPRGPRPRRDEAPQAARSPPGQTAHRQSPPAVAPARSPVHLGAPSPPPRASRRPAHRARARPARQSAPNRARPGQPQAGIPDPASAAHPRFRRTRIRVARHETRRSGQGLCGASRHTPARSATPSPAATRPTDHRSDGPPRRPRCDATTESPTAPAASRHPAPTNRSPARTSNEPRIRKSNFLLPTAPRTLRQPPRHRGVRP